MATEPNQDYYQLLHVHPSAPMAIIKASYRTLMQQLKAHPDLGGDHAQAALINEAYATLTDENRRAAYDAERTEETAAPPPKSGGRRSSADVDSPAPSTSASCAFCGQTRFGEADTCTRCRSPLTIVARSMSHAQDSRAIERLQKRQPLRFFTHWPQPALFGATVDISLDGMLFESPIQLTQGQLIKLDCDVCHATAQVAHCKPHGAMWRVGVAFTTLEFQQSRGGFVSAQA